MTATGAQSGTATPTFTDALKTNTTLTSSPNPSTTNQSVTFTATVSCDNNNGCSFDNTNANSNEKVEFWQGSGINSNCNNGTTLLGTVPASQLTGSGSSRTATLTQAFSTTGNKPVTACFFGGGQDPAAGSSVSNTVTQVVNAPPDTTPPSVAITSPNNNSSTTNSSINVTGTASDASGIQGVTVNGNAATFSGGNWIYNNLSLSCGQNTIMAVATDNSTNHNTNSASITVTRNCDTTAPTSTASAKNAGDNSTYNGGTSWTNQNVNVTLSATDGGTSPSGVKEIRYTTDGTAPTATTGTVYNAPFTVSSTTTVKYLAVDNAGNAESPNTFQVDIDKVAPAPNCGSADGAWRANDVSIPCTADDTGGSGLANTGDGSFNLTTSVPAGTETANASTGSRDVADAVGNKATAGPISGNMVDKKAPSTGASTGAYNGGWTNQTVTVTLGANDGGSGVDKTEYKVDAGTFQTYNGAFTVGSDGDHTITYRSTDKVGNPEADQTLNVKVDKTPPQFSCDQPDGNWHGSDVTLNCTASDSSSGLANPADGSFSLSTSVAAGDETASASTDSKVLTDAAGNSVTAGPISGNKVDKKAPTFGNCPAGGPFQLNSGGTQHTQSVGPIPASDGGSLVDNANSTLSVTVNTSTVGKKSVTFTAKDNVGNQSSTSCDYYVDYLGGFGGIQQPINGGLTPSLTADGTNLANAAFSDDNSRFKLGSTIPVKFTLTDATGAPVTGATANLYLKKADNSPDAGVDEAVSTAASTTGNLFRYDATSGQYIFNLSTKNTYVNVDNTSVPMAQGTYTITVKLDDGTSRSVNINLVK